MDHMGHRIGLC